MMISRYRYLTLWHQPSRSRGTAAPFAVVVEARDGRCRKVISIGRYLAGDEETVTGQLMKNFPDVLLERLNNAIDVATDKQTVVDLLRTEFSWNVFAKKPRTTYRWSRRSCVAVAHEIFVDEVETPSAEPSAAKEGLFELTLPLSVATA